MYARFAQCPDMYPKSAVDLTERLLCDAIQNGRLVRNGRDHETPLGYLLSAEEFARINKLLSGATYRSEVAGFIRTVFEEVFPRINYILDSEGLRLANDEWEPCIVVSKKLRPGNAFQLQSAGFEKSLRVAHDAVRALVEWRLHFECKKNPFDIIDSGANIEIIDGATYGLIVRLGYLGNCWTWDVVDFIRAAMPEHFEKWDAWGLELKPMYSAWGDWPNREFLTALRLVSGQPGATPTPVQPD